MVAAGHQGDVLGGRVDGAGVDRGGHDVVDPHLHRHLQRVVALEARQLDDLLDQPGEPVALVQHPAGEALHGLGVVGGLVDRLGQQPDGAHGGLQLVAHVGHEVAAHGLDPTLAGAVLDQRQHEARPQGSDARDHGAGRRAVAGELHLGLADLAVAAYDVDQVAQVLDEDLVAAHQPEGVGRRGGLEHVVVGVHDHRGGAQHGQHGGHAGRHEWLVDVRQAALLSVADVPGEYGAAGDDRPDDGSQRCLGRRVHVSIVRTSRGHDPPLDAMAPVLCPEFTTRSPPRSGGRVGPT